MTAATTTEPLLPPGRGFGLADVFRRRYLLSLIVRKEVQIRYRGSALGWVWSYVKPLVQFAVFYLAIGVFLGMNARVEYFPLYLLSGITIVTFFNEAFTNGTRSLVDNAALIKKIYLPREMFPVSSMLIAAVNILPQIAVLVVIALVFGWAPSVLQVLALLLAIALIAALATGLGLLFGAVNVTFRDAQSFVEIITMFAVWASPVMYQWEMVAEKVPDWLFVLYRLNPVTAAVELFHYGIWFPLDPAGGRIMPDMWLFSGIAAVMSMVFLIIGQTVFRSLEGRFAQDL
ncbi:ABC transporter permease [Microbacterium imperiale]|uniref:Transport permease protein n=1 Tax=Microbacterium imperiale TaxID=33884 RepID=A0A9W6M202_9MICO|nr:ABC transporter permease [Microbacterium imperiale]MBP2420248.1 ABC-2 type transport system permease protein [Microbacterium imperiale]MDS0197889.1 ABC transporter permease [Microbacterium imperiale]BFE40590.1 ABC transporter permease [Microbacterium imperiale]GLJ78436.1 transport permease protein [Microbacterium imperiale]